MTLRVSSGMWQREWSILTLARKPTKIYLSCFWHTLDKGASSEHQRAAVKWCLTLTFRPDCSSRQFLNYLDNTIYAAMHHNDTMDIPADNLPNTGDSVDALYNDIAK